MSRSASRSKRRSPSAIATSTLPNIMTMRRRLATCLRFFALFILLCITKLSFFASEIATEAQAEARRDFYYDKNLACRRQQRDRSAEARRPIVAAAENEVCAQIYSFKTTLEFSAISTAFSFIIQRPTSATTNRPRMRTIDANVGWRLKSCTASFPPFVKRK